MTPIHFSEVVTGLTAWLSKVPLVGTLLIMMALDTISGLAAAFATKRLSSTISWRGMSKKVIMLLLTGVASVLEPFANDLPLSKLVAMFYVMTEAISVLENAARVGVPLPRVLVDTLFKLKDAADDTNKVPPPSPGKVTVKLAGELHTEPSPQPTVNQSQPTNS